ncbi:unnamed protein product [Miscanthus lutarioriparius]|uniref:Uncharacterized protein n=1 Tax=Miscanthus lutarioriparius TaxID=422564 RepID=A0A811RMF5_9POAL|nr:unnamed protein product [Miscanthus lutarioriparius]
MGRTRRMSLHLQPPSKLQAPPKDPAVPVIASPANGTARRGHNRPSALPPFPWRYARAPPSVVANAQAQEAMGRGSGVGFNPEMGRGRGPQRTEFEHRDVLQRKRPPYGAEIDDWSYFTMFGIRDVSVGPEQIVLVYSLNLGSLLEPGTFLCNDDHQMIVGFRWEVLRAGTF